MADRQILFSAPMVRALLAGRKTQTRRVLDIACDEAPAIVDDGVIVAFDENDRTYRWPRTHAVGDRLWVREAWRADVHYDDTPPRDLRKNSAIFSVADRQWSAGNGVEGRLRASMHMPKWASRLTLIVTDVRVQRLQEISAADAIAEGIFCRTYGELASAGLQHIDNGPTDASRKLFSAWDPFGPEARGCWHSAANAYHELWDDLNEERGYGWDANPWVAAYSVTVHRVNIGKVEG